MNNINPPRTGKISIHGEGAGPITTRDVDARAREIALIEGHLHITDEDRQRARDELHGRNLEPTGAEVPESQDSLSRDPSDPPSNRGHQIPNYEGADEQKTPERLVAEGVEEADHELMLEARRVRDRT